MERMKYESSVSSAGRELKKRDLLMSRSLNILISSLLVSQFAQAMDLVQFDCELFQGPNGSVTTQNYSGREGDGGQQITLNDKTCFLDLRVNAETSGVSLTCNGKTLSGFGVASSAPSFDASFPDAGPANLKCTNSKNSKKAAQVQKTLKGRLIVLNEAEKPSSEEARWAIETPASFQEFYLVPQATQHYHKEVQVTGYFADSTEKANPSKTVFVVKDIKRQ
jgi:hypothetical protein